MLEYQHYCNKQDKSRYEISNNVVCATSKGSDQRAHTPQQTNTPVKTPVCIKKEPVHEISNNVVCATSKASDQHVHTRSLIRAFARRLNIQ